MKTWAKMQRLKSKKMDTFAGFFPGHGKVDLNFSYAQFFFD
jgi:hypothetical protein